MVKTLQKNYKKKKHSHDGGQAMVQGYDVTHGVVAPLLCHCTQNSYSTCRVGGGHHNSTAHSLVAKWRAQ